MMVETFSKVTEGYYFLRDGEGAVEVAKAVYGGDASKAGSLLHANPEEWFPEDYITIPGKGGRVANIKPMESPNRLIQRMFPGQPTHLYLKQFYLWNGGEHREFYGGELVFVPER